MKKAVAEILAGRSDASLAFEDLCYVLQRTGFIKDSVDEIINLQSQGGKAKPYQVKQVRDLIVKYQLEID